MSQICPVLTLPPTWAGQKQGFTRHLSSPSHWWALRARCSGGAAAGLPSTCTAQGREGGCTFRAGSWVSWRGGHCGRRSCQRVCILFPAASPLLAGRSSGCLSASFHSGHSACPGLPWCSELCCCSAGGCMHSRQGGQSLPWVQSQSCPLPEVAGPPRAHRALPPGATGYPCCSFPERTRDLEFLAEPGAPVPDPPPGHLRCRYEGLHVPVWVP